jgi:hypothetical protein
MASGPSQVRYVRTRTGMMMMSARTSILTVPVTVPVRTSSVRTAGQPLLKASGSACVPLPVVTRRLPSPSSWIPSALIVVPFNFLHAIIAGALFACCKTCSTFTSQYIPYPHPHNHTRHHSVMTPAAATSSAATTTAAVASPKRSADSAYSSEPSTPSGPPSSSFLLGNTSVTKLGSTGALPRPDEAASLPHHVLKKDGTRTGFTNVYPSVGSVATFSTAVRKIFWSVTSLSLYPWIVSPPLTD